MLVQGHPQNPALGTPLIIPAQGKAPSHHHKADHDGVTGMNQTFLLFPAVSGGGRQEQSPSLASSWRDEPFRAHSTPVTPARGPASLRLTPGL